MSTIEAVIPGAGPGRVGLPVRLQNDRDTSDRAECIEASVQLAVDRDDLGEELRPWFTRFAAGL